MYDDPPAPTDITHIALGNHDTGTSIHARIYYDDVPAYQHQPAKINPFANINWPDVFAGELISIPGGNLYPPEQTSNKADMEVIEVFDELIREHVDVREAVQAVVADHAVTAQQAIAAYHVDALRTPPHEVAERIGTIPNHIVELRNEFINVVAPGFDDGFEEMHMYTHGINTSVEDTKRRR